MHVRAPCLAAGIIHSRHTTGLSILAKQTIAELEARIEELESLLANDTPDLPRGRVYLEGPVKFFRQAMNRASGEPMNYYEFVVANSSQETRPDGSTYRVDMPFDQCRISGKRSDLVREMQSLFQGNSFLVLRLHGAWRPDGRVTLDRGYARAERKSFWVSGYEVLHTIGRDQMTERSAPVPVAAKPAFAEDPTLDPIAF